MSIYYYGELVGVYNPKEKQTSEPTLVGDIVKQREDYKTYMKPRKEFVVRHYQDGETLTI
jgi:hypothetical protein